MYHSKANKKYLASAALLLALSACGKSGNDAAAPAAAGAPAASTASLQSSGNGNNYVTSSSVNYVGASGAAGSLPAGTSVTMLETKNGYVHLGVDSDDTSLPADVWVKVTEAAAARFVAQPERDLNESDDSVFEDVGRGTGGGMTYCYRYVKEYLLKHGLVNQYLPGGSAYQAAQILPQYGWHKLAGGPENTKINDVCVYHGGRGGNGHAEVRVPGGWYYGYGVKPNSISRRNHPFIGCFRK